MKFKEAYSIALEMSAEFRRHDERVKNACKDPGTAKAGSFSICFSTEPGEVFYYGWDGCCAIHGKLSPYRANQILRREQALILYCEGPARF